MYPTTLERKGYSEILKFNYFTLANLSLIHELEGAVNNSVWIIPSVDNNDFQGREIKLDELANIFNLSMLNGQLKKVIGDIQSDSNDADDKSKTKVINIPKENDI